MEIVLAIISMPGCMNRQSPNVFGGFRGSSHAGFRSDLIISVPRDFANKLPVDIFPR